MVAVKFVKGNDGRATQKARTQQTCMYMYLLLECHFGDILVLPIRALCERYIEWREVPRTSGKRRSVSAVIAVIEQHLRGIDDHSGSASVMRE
jgi:hypothetical protein